MNHLTKTYWIKYSGRILVALCVCIYIVGAISVAQTPVAKGLLKSSSTSASTTESDVSIDSVANTEGDVEAIVAPLTDAQVRRLLIARLQQEDMQQSAEMASATNESVFVGLLQSLQDTSVMLSERTDMMFGALVNATEHWRIVMRNLTDNQGAVEIIKATAILVLMIVVGAIAEFAVFRLMNEIRYQLEQTSTHSTLQKMRFLLLRFGLEIIGLAVFTVTAYLASFLFFERFAPLRIYVVAYLLVVISIRFARAISCVIFAPTATNLRLLPLTNQRAQYLHSRFVLLVGVTAFGIFTCGLLKILGLNEGLHQLMVVVAGTLTASIIMLVILQSREAVSNALRANSATTGAVNTVSGAIANLWYFFAIAFLLLVWALWSLNQILGRAEQAGAAVSSLLILASLPLVDYLVRQLFAWLFDLHAHAPDERNLNQEDNMSPENAQLPIQSEVQTQRQIDNQRYAAVFQNVVRVLLIAVACYVLSDALGLEIKQMLDQGSGGRFVASGFNILVTLLLAYVVWGLTKVAINRHLPDVEVDDNLAAMDGEGGESAPATRLETLLPLLRSFIFIVLIVIVTMIVLSAMGVNIGPLLAGAGVVGLAIGFGAQTLVQDIISGVFFLIDDAFRVGEYIEAAGMRGTVENISIRSMRLRHHLGPVQTIPYSEVATVKNHSRDYVIMKLTFRLPYDTDIEKVRKTIKKVGQELLKHPELGDSFIAPLKSQGVLEMDDSAMVMRMKFTAKPGEQWLLRREVYRSVKDALQQQGIHFAHRQVTVHVPNAEGDATKANAIAGAAAAVSMAEAEQEKLKKENPEDQR